MDKKSIDFLLWKDVRSICFFSIRPLLDNTSAISPVSQLFCLLSKNAHNAPKILHKLGLQFVCNDCNTREKLGKMVTKNKAKCKQSVLLTIQKLRISPVDTCNIAGHVNLSLLLMRQVVNNTSKVREFLIMSVWSLHVL